MVEVNTVDLGITQDEIEAPVLLPEGWTVVKIVGKPEVRPNEAFKNDPQDPKAGHNWVVNVQSVSDEPEFSGRRLTLWLPVPRPQDKEEWTNRGQRVSHAKAERILQFVEAFGGSVTGSEVTLSEGLQGQVYVDQRINQTTGEVENSINPFQGFKKVDEL